MKKVTGATIAIVMALSVSGCATIDKAKMSVCAKKAEAIEAAQAVIDALNANCPLEVETGGEIVSD
jgi:outer membrane lipoprotein SlyB